MEARREAEAKFEEIAFSVELLTESIESETSPIKLLQITKKINALDGELEALAVPDAMHEKHNALRKSVQNAAAAAQQKALEVTRE